jgi:pimeloyl-ACP methyl ester carboxylesterase
MLNITVIKFLQKQFWVSKNKLVVAGHSEGSTIAAKMALRFSKVTQLIYSGGNPFGRILSIIEKQRESENDSSKTAEQQFVNWQNIVADPKNMDVSQGDTYKATYDFSIPPIRYLEKLKIPVLVCYGTKDYSSPYNDYLRVETVRKQRKNFTFKAYIGTEHNYFPIKENGETNYDLFNWDKVAEDWRLWLMLQ